MSVVPEHRPLSPRLARKAANRHAEGRVRFLPHVRTYGVQGDTPGSFYKVTVERIDGADHMSCDCPANGPCWHKQAVRIARRHGTEPAHNLGLPA
jgi:hypothetical protein